MADKFEKIGDSIIGFLFDGVDDRLAPPVAEAVLKESGLIVVTVPFIHPECIDVDDTIRASFKKTKEWAHSNRESVPEGLVLKAVGQSVTLANLTSGGFAHSAGMGASVFQAGVAILGEPRKILDTCSIEKFTSTIDGLREFAQFQGFTYRDVEDSDVGDRFPIRLFQVAPVSWNSGGLEFRIEMHQPWSAQAGNYLHLEVVAELSTVSSSGVAIMEHFNAQRKIRALLTLILGTRLPWRSHSLTDKQFSEGPLSGESLPPTPVKVLLSRTLKEHEEPAVSGARLFNSAVTLETLGAAGLKTWCDRYDEDEVFHAVAPAVEAIANRNAFVEPSVLMLAGACERFGYLLTRKNSSVAKQFEACLGASRFEVLEMNASVTEVSKFLARVYNGLKHPDYKLGYPDSLDIVVAHEVFKLLARSQALVLIGVKPSVIEEFLRSEGQTLKRTIGNNAFPFAGLAEENSVRQG
ncbi:MAG: hypothetical protein SOX57_06065 [Schaalia hyovaginalis]|uniref:ApeA N-terminal domain 1-containing protein n=1 Tax=Schaalia hyovaginalis TaxID=29316 RepID=UPI0026F261FE|nr:hypothetical protein [Schaalia hyovaginalis]MCI7512029.1 hypothetical protein [Schaalia hyovaginalis]MDY4262880.1 hypothetical protein [Schaalia hyovaginalis]